MTDNPEALEARLLAVVPYQGKSQVAFLCHEAAEALSSLRAQLAEMEAALSNVLDHADQSNVNEYARCPHCSAIEEIVGNALASKEGGRDA